jgi:hypothetical protein
MCSKREMSPRGTMNSQRVVGNDVDGNVSKTAC